MFATLCYILDCVIMDSDHSFVSDAVNADQESLDLDLDTSLTPAALLLRGRSGAVIVGEG